MSYILDNKFTISSLQWEKCQLQGRKYTYKYIYTNEKKKKKNYMTPYYLLYGMWDITNSFENKGLG